MCMLCVVCLFCLCQLGGTLLGLQVFVLSCAASVGNISMGNVSVIQGGRARNAVLGMMNVRFLTAMVMVTVSMGSALVSVDIWESSVRKVSDCHMRCDILILR